MSRPVASTAIAPFNLPLNAKRIVAERLWSGIPSSSGWLRHLRLWPFRRAFCFLLTLTGVAQAAQYPCRVASARLCGERSLFDSTRPGRPVPHQNSSVALHGAMEDYLFGRGR